MKQFVVKYWRRIVFYAILLLLCILFLGEDTRHYLRSDYKAFLPATHIAFIILLGIWLCVIVITGRKQLESIWQVLGVTALLAIRFAFIYFIFHQLFSGICFAVNRQYHGAPIPRQYSVSSTTVDNETFLLKDITTGELVSYDNMPGNYQLPAGHKLKDTITIPFTKGLFGVPYIGK